MSANGLAELAEEIRRASAAIAAGDSRTDARIEKMQRAIDALYLRMGRPGGFPDSDDDEGAAHQYCVLKHLELQPRIERGAPPYTPSHDEIEQAISARTGLRMLMRGSDINTMPQDVRKGLSSFSMGQNAFLMPPELSNVVVSCVVDPTNVASLMGQATTSTGSLKFLIDNVRVDTRAAWACEANCFANNPSFDEPLGELEIKTETLRYVACIGPDLLADSAFNFESWLLTKVSKGFSDAVNAAVIAGDGLGKPLGILNPNSGIPILATSPSTPPGQFSWQDLVQLKFDLPMEYHAANLGAGYIMNQRTWALILTMSDALGRPLLVPSPADAGQFLLNGSPVYIATQFPDVGLGNTPVAFGAWKSVYCVLTRQGVTMVHDPFSAGFCHLYKFSMRVGGALLCPTAARLLRVQH